MGLDQGLKDRVNVCIINIGLLGKSYIKDTAKLDNDLGLDSIDQIELLIALEIEFNIAINDDAAEDVGTIGDIYNMVAKILS